MKIVILDRDGVINQDSDAYIKSPDEWQPIPGSLEAIGRLCAAGYRVFVATNQAGVGRGLLDLSTLHAIHERMQQACAACGGHIEGIEYAAEHPDQATERRKPGPGMLFDIARRAGVSVTGVPFVGDSLRDVQAAQAAGALPVLVRTGNGRRTEAAGLPESVHVYEDLWAFASALLGD